VTVKKGGEEEGEGRGKRKEEGIKKRALILGQ